ncbi:MAG: sensor histidine kinase [Thermocrispum sp.]
MFVQTAIGALCLSLVLGIHLIWYRRLRSSARAGGQTEAAQEELVRVAVACERLRFSRDVHDLLGLSLSALTLKAELAHRLLATQPERAGEQLAEIGELARRATADVRSAARGYAELHLDDELCLARSLLASAAIEVRVSRGSFAIPGQQERVLATVAREGVTNVLRHSKAEHCQISVRRRRGRVRLEIVNDGLSGGSRALAPANGIGIRNLSHRVNAIGGDLAAGARPDGTYWLRASVPLGGAG